LTGRFYDVALSRFPNLIQIETTNACNAKCLMCTHRKMRRPVRYMAPDLYRRIIDECADRGCEKIHLHNFGEPLLDRNIAEFIRYAKKKGIKQVQMFSNGSLLGSAKAREVIDAGLDEIKISFDGATKGEFERIRFPLKFEQVLNNVQELVRIRDQKGARLKVKVACCSTSDKGKTMQILEGIVDEFSFGKTHNWANQEVGHDRRTNIRKPCSRIWRTFTVLASGDVALCCLDYEGEVILGNVMKSSIHDIWLNSRYRELRRYHQTARQDEIRICSLCTKSFW
jgi:radical SAM protein with 4Fe4S-binding SPASM domain